MRINAVFEGGGVKAIALAGAASAAEQSGISFHKVAGTSSGSIIASLLAVGYNAEEIKELVLQTSFKSFLKTSGIYKLKYLGPVARLFIRKGLYSGDRLESWIAEKLRKKGVVTFGDLENNKLRIIASDISQGKLLVLPDDIGQYGFNPAKFSVAKAIRMSTSLPYFFEPVIFRKPVSNTSIGEKFSKQFIYIVDGGILSNFPLWIFDKEQRGNREQVPTLGFQLVGKHANIPRQINGPLSMFHALFSTMMDAHDEKYIEDHNRFRTIKIPANGVQATEFDLSAEKSKELYESGLQAGTAYFEKWTMSAYIHSFKQTVICE